MVYSEVLTLYYVISDARGRDYPQEDTSRGSSTLSSSFTSEVVNSDTLTRANTEDLHLDPAARASVQWKRFIITEEFESNPAKHFLAGNI